LGIVKLLSESSIGSGVRRVEAIVGADAYRHLAKEHIILDSISRLIKGSRVDELPSRINDLMESLKAAEKEIALFNREKAMQAASLLIEKKQTINASDVLVVQIADGISGDDLRVIALDLRNKISNGVVVLASRGEDKTTIVAALSDHARNQGLKAGELVKAGSAVLKGGGGGKDDFAQGGGSAHEKISEAFEVIARTIKDSL
jgi:alanyl-tRNA synthetase